MPSIADDPAAELRELRRRAYGPGADIHDDPTAMTRLHELENGARAAAPAQEDLPAPPPLPAPGPVTEALPEQTADAQQSTTDAATDASERAAGRGIPPADAATTETPAARVPWWRRRMRLLWPASLVAAALIGAAATLSVQAVGAGQVAVLAEDPDGEWPENIWDPAPAGARIFEPFNGLTVLAVPQDFGGTSQDCLYITDDANAFGSGGCSAGTFPAIATLMVSRDAPQELRDRFGVGSALQFVQEDDRVRVYAGRAAPGGTPER